MISIIVPIYNSEKWLERCIESLINQTCEDIEIILINDGSDDGCLEICRRYEEKDKRIIVIDKDNEGVSATRNMGIRSAHGEFIQFVDSDDFIEPDMCEKMLATIEGCDMALCGMRIRQGGVILREPHVESGIYDLRENISTYFELRTINLGPCNKLYRKDLVSKLFREDVSLGEDTLFVVDYMRRVKKIAALSDCLYNVVLDNENSLNRRPKLEKIDSLISQRKEEEVFLRDMYGADADYTEMYNCYLLQLHTHFLQVYFSGNALLKKTMKRYLKDSFLQEKIRGAKPERFDYRIFKRIYNAKSMLLLRLYFWIKSIWYGRKGEKKQK